MTDRYKIQNLLPTTNSQPSVQPKAIWGEWKYRFVGIWNGCSIDICCSTVSKYTEKTQGVPQTLRIFRQKKYAYPQPRNTECKDSDFNNGWETIGVIRIFASTSISEIGKTTTWEYSNIASFERIIKIGPWGPELTCQLNVTYQQHEVLAKWFRTTHDGQFTIIGSLACMPNELKFVHIFIKILNFSYVTYGRIIAIFSRVCSSLNLYVHLACVIFNHRYR